MTDDELEAANHVVDVARDIYAETDDFFSSATLRFHANNRQNLQKETEEMDSESGRRTAFLNLLGLILYDDLAFLW
jgi:hypothetical protein